MARAGERFIRWWIAVSCAVAFAALAVSVHLGLLDSFDSIIREWARPDDVWGTAQLRADYVVEGLRPAVLAILLAAFTVAFSVLRRSLRPLVFVGGVCLITAAVTFAAKMAVGRPDTHGTTTNSHGGSFPSGHIIAVVVCLGLALLVAQPRVRRWVWLIPGLVALVMAVCIMLQAAHWSTDVVGGGVLATGILVAVSASGWPRWSHGGQRSRQGSRPGMRAESSLRPAGTVRPDDRVGSHGVD
jgi:membrane-associated phospholipid phosphatase